MRKILLLLLASLWLYADGPVLKTGQTAVYQTGDDGTYQTGIARSYTRDNANGIVTDNTTGLIWQDNTVSPVMNWTSAGTYCEDLTLGGQTDWRLPSVSELRTLVDKGRLFPIDPTFQNTTSAYHYWSTTTYTDDSSSVFVTEFYNGSDYVRNKSNDGLARCVRGTFSISTSTYLRDNATQTVYDSQTNLTWQDDANVSNQTKTWTNAINHCENLTFAGMDDWRLPNSNELFSILDNTRISPAIDPTFAHVASNYYWSSTVHAGVSSAAWDINFNGGHNYENYMSASFYVRCVRSGQLVNSSSSSVASSASSSSVSSSSSSINPNQTYASVQLSEGWNLISVPFNTDDEFDISSLIQNMATIGWKFRYITNEGDTYSWDKWERGTSLRLKNGEGLFVGVPHTILPHPSDYISFQGIRKDTLLKFENKTYVQNKWYLLGFGYELKVSDILALYPNSVIWVMENGAYKKLSNADTIKIGQGFWFKYH